MNSGDNYTELQTTQSTVFIVDDQTTSLIIIENIAISKLHDFSLTGEFIN